MGSDRSRNGSQPGGRGPVMALVAVVLLVGLVYWAIQAIVQHNALQNCLDSGRRDCAERSGGP